MINNKNIIPDLVAITGSHLYGTATPSSDIDRRGFAVGTINQILDIERFDQYEDRINDTVIYSLRKFFNDLIRGNTQLLEVLFSEPEYITDAGRLVLDNRSLFISQHFYRNIRGFALAEFRKVKGVRLHIEASTDKQTEAFHNFCSAFNLERIDRQDIIDFVERVTGQKITHEISNKPSMGEQRRSHIEQHGYSVKNASHAIRLLEQGIELLSTGQLQFPRPTASKLLEIKRGMWSLEQVENEYNRLNKQLELIKNESKLPEKPNIVEINRLYKRIVMERLCNDS